MHLILIGFRGSGKTTFGRRLAKSFQWPWIDTDLCIEEMMGQSYRDIWKEKGETFYRSLERQVIANLPYGNAVVSTGGGCVLDPNNVTELKRRGRLIYLDTPQEIEPKYRHRLPIYLSVADIVAPYGQQ